MLLAAQANITPIGALQTAAAVVAALGVIGGGLAWIFLPHLDKRIKDIAEAAAIVKHELRPNSGESLHDNVKTTRDHTVENAGRLDDLDARLQSHLLEAQEARGRQYQAEQDIRAITRLLMSRFGRRTEDQEQFRDREGDQS